MSRIRVTALCAALATVGALAARAPVSAQQYPTKTVKIFVAFAPGSPPDLMGRSIAQPLTTALGRQVLVEKNSGAGGLIGTEAGVKSPSDWYTLTLISSSYTTSPSLYKLKFDSVTDITPIILISQGPLLVVVHPSLPVTTTQELIALAKAKPEKLNFAS